MKQFCSFPEIGQYRNIVKTITDRAHWMGKDENGEPIFDRSRKAGVKKFTGTIKLHGSNAGVTFNQEGEYWAGSRTQIITPLADNAGFASFVESNRDAFKELASKIPFNGYDMVTIFGEWCGENIQKGVAICGLPKMFVIFDIKRSYYTSVDEGGLTVESPKGPNLYSTIEEIKTLRSPENLIFNIYDYPTYEIEVDFDNPGLSQNKMIEITAEVENECPVGKAFGVSGIGEGVVWCYQDEDGVKYRYKVKGDKHSGASKVKTLKPVDDQRLQLINEVADKVTPVWRLAQMYKTLQGESEEVLERSKIGEYIKLVMADVVKEDLDIIVDAKLELKDVGGKISGIAKDYFFSQETL